MTELEDSPNQNYSQSDSYNNQEDEFEDTVGKSPEKEEKEEEYQEVPEKPEPKLNIDDPKILAYFDTLSEYDKNRYRVLQEKNTRLVLELQNITDATQNILDKETEKRKIRNVYEEPAEVTEKKSQLRQKQNEAFEIKARINHKKKQLYGDFILPLVRDKENELKSLKKVFAARYKEKQSIEKIMSQQKQALEEHVNGLESEEVQQKALEDVRAFNQKNRDLYEKITVQEKFLKQNHNKVYDLKMFLRNYRKKYEKSQNSNSLNKEKITQQDSDSLESEIESLKNQLADQKKTYKEQTSILEKAKYDQMEANLANEDKIKLRDKEIRLYKLKLKEVQRLARIKAYKPNRKPPPEADLDKANKIQPGFDFTTNSNEANTKTVNSRNETSKVDSKTNKSEAENSINKSEKQKE